MRGLGWAGWGGDRAGVPGERAGLGRVGGDRAGVPD